MIHQFPRMRFCIQILLMATVLPACSLFQQEDPKFSSENLTLVRRFQWAMHTESGTRTIHFESEAGNRESFYFSPVRADTTGRYGFIKSSGYTESYQVLIKPRLPPGTDCPGTYGALSVSLSELYGLYYDLEFGDYYTSLDVLVPGNSESLFDTTGVLELPLLHIPGRRHSRECPPEEFDRLLYDLDRGIVGYRKLNGTIFRRVWSSDAERDLLPSERLSY